MPFPWQWERSASPSKETQGQFLWQCQSRISWGRGKTLISPCWIATSISPPGAMARDGTFVISRASELCFSCAKAVSCQIPDSKFLESYQLPLQTRMEKQWSKLQEKTHPHCPDNSVNEGVRGKPPRAFRYPLGEAYRAQQSRYTPFCNLGHVAANSCSHTSIPPLND